MLFMETSSAKKRFGTLPVFFTVISTILGAVLFLRFGFAVGTLGFWGAVLLIMAGHVVTIPTALAISASAEDMLENQLIMSKIAIGGVLIVPLGLSVSLMVMFKINTLYALTAILLMIVIYSFINHYHRTRQGIESLFANALFQINRNLLVFLRKSGSSKKDKERGDC